MIQEFTKCCVENIPFPAIDAGQIEMKIGKKIDYVLGKIGEKISIK